MGDRLVLRFGEFTGTVPADKDDSKGLCSCTSALANHIWLKSCTAGAVFENVGRPYLVRELGNCSIDAGNTVTNSTQYLAQHFQSSCKNIAKSISRALLEHFIINQENTSRPDFARYKLRCEIRAQAALLVAAVGASLCVSTVQDSEHEASAHLVREPGLCTGVAGIGGAMWLPCAWCGCSQHRDELGDRMCYCDVCEGTWHEQPWLATEECVLENVLMPRREACRVRWLATTGGLPRPES